MSLYCSYGNMKQGYMREIDNARTENKVLFEQRNEY
ncbi:Hypothetical protein BOM_1380 (plasmid) [Borrelia miyamotoi FR64b]|uniref:Uncharacterized protein n=1 Tax=Borrelia miyamotoi FR64b TaxID=1292392 RepID=W5SGZ1_9SPIR|nr:Hypothetical protein BOM_1380 [Borrelia miyamotoi FR64b]